MKKFVIVLVVISSVLIPAVIVNACVWELSPAYVYQSKFYSTYLAGYGEHKLVPVVVDSPFGAYFRTEGLGNAVIEIYQTPGPWRDYSHNFSNGGAELAGQIIFQDDYVYLPKGEYILKIVAGDDVSEIRMIFGPRMKP